MKPTIKIYFKDKKYEELLSRYPWLISSTRTRPIQRDWTRTHKTNRPTNIKVNTVRNASVTCNNIFKTINLDLKNKEELFEFI